MWVVGIGRLRPWPAVLSGTLRGIWLFGGLGLVVLPASADNSGRPMTFEWGVVYTDVPAIFADGDFTPETPAALRSFLSRSGQPTRDRTIYFNSLGGDLGAGMEVGKIVRKAELNTGVARNTRDASQANQIDLDFNSRVYAGHCVSACSLAFLGGVKRDVKPGSIFAVHQVSMNCVDKRKALSKYPWVAMPNVNYCPELNEALTMMQVANGVVVEYVRSMGVDPIFLTEMSRAGPEAINTLPKDKLREYRIIYEFRTESWDFQTDAQGPSSCNTFTETSGAATRSRSTATARPPRASISGWFTTPAAPTAPSMARRSSTSPAAASPPSGRWTRRRRWFRRRALDRAAALRDHRPAQGHRARPCRLHRRPVAPLPRRALRRDALPDRDHRTRRPDRTGLQPHHDEPRPRQAVGYCPLLPLTCRRNPR